MMNKLELGNFIMNEFANILNKNENIGIYDNKYYSRFFTFEDFKNHILNNYITLDIWIEKIYQEKHSYTFIFKNNYVSDIISNRIGKYPWSINFTSVVIPYINEFINDNDVLNFYYMYNKTYHVIEDIFQEADEKMYGTDKFVNALQNYNNTIINAINSFSRKINVESFVINTPRITNKFNIEIMFNRYLNYPNKKSFKEKFFNFLNSYYREIINNTPNYYTVNNIQGFRWYFNDNSTKTNPCNSITIEIEANNYNAIAMDSNTQFIPIMKKFK